MGLFSSGSSDATTKPRLDSVAAADQHNVIGKGTVIEGTLRASGSVHVSGTILGNVEVEGRTVVMPGGVVEGEVVSTSAEIGGRVRGEVRVAERLALKATAVVEGDIHTAKLVIEEGAVFNGRCEMAAAGLSERPAARRGAGEPERPAPPAEASRLTRRLGGSPDAAVAA